MLLIYCILNNCLDCVFNLFYWDGSPGFPRDFSCSITLVGGFSDLGWAGTIVSTR